MRWALVELNPGRTRRVRLGRKRVYTVRIDKKTARVLGGVRGGGRVPKMWIGVPWKRVGPLERALRQLARANAQCVREQGTCWEPTRDRRGRRRRCKDRIRNLAEFVEAFDDALDGGIWGGRGTSGAIDYTDDGSPVLADLKSYAGKRGRYIKSWGESFRLAMPRSRRWSDVEKPAVRRLSEFWETMLSRNEYPGQFRLELPPQTQRFREAELLRDECDRVAAEGVDRAMAEARAELAELVAKLPDLDDVPF